MPISFGRISCFRNEFSAPDAHQIMGKIAPASTVAETGPYMN